MMVLIFALCFGLLWPVRPARVDSKVLKDLSPELPVQPTNLTAESAVHLRNASVTGKDRKETSEEVKVHQKNASVVDKDSNETIKEVSTNVSMALVGLDSFGSFGGARSSTQATYATAPKEAPMSTLSACLLLLLAGTFTGCSILCCLAKFVPKEEESEAVLDNINDQDDTPVSLSIGVKRRLSSALANLADVIPSMAAAPRAPLKTNVCRLVFTDTFFKLDDELARHFVENIASNAVLPVQCASEVSQKSAWHRCTCRLIELEDGLFLDVGSEEEGKPHQLLNWSDNSGPELQVSLLPKITWEMTRMPRLPSLKMPTQDDDSEGSQDQEESNPGTEDLDVRTSAVSFRAGRDSVHLMTKAATTKEPTSLQAFAIKWNKTCIAVLGCEDEDVCDKWVHTVNVCSNIRQRYYADFMWKLNSDIASGLPMDFDEAKGVLSDVRHWCKRLCLLEHLHSEQSLCISIQSEKDGEARVKNVLVRAERGDVASVQAVPPVPLMPLASWAEEEARVNAHQYCLALAGASIEETPLPKVFYGVEVRERSTEYGGQKHSMYAFEDEASRAFFLAVVESASKEAKTS